MERRGKGTWSSSAVGKLGVRCVVSVGSEGWGEFSGNEQSGSGVQDLDVGFRMSDQENSL